MERSELLHQNNSMRWEFYGLTRRLQEIQTIIDDAEFYIKNPLELQKKYLDVFDYVYRYLNIKYNSQTKFKNKQEMFCFLYSKRKNIHLDFKELKKKRKQVKNKLSRMPK